MGRPRTGERFDVKFGPRWVLPLNAEREGADGDVVVVVVDDSVCCVELGVWGDVGVE